MHPACAFLSVAATLYVTTPLDTVFRVVSISSGDVATYTPSTHIPSPYGIVAYGIPDLTYLNLYISSLVTSVIYQVDLTQASLLPTIELAGGSSGMYPSREEDDVT